MRNTRGVLLRERNTFTLEHDGGRVEIDKPLE